MRDFCWDSQRSVSVMEINSSGSAILYLQLEINPLQKKCLSAINLDTMVPQRTFVTELWGEFSGTICLPTLVLLGSALELFRKFFGAVRAIFWLWGSCLAPEKWSTLAILQSKNGPKMWVVPREKRQFVKWTLFPARSHPHPEWICFGLETDPLLTLNLVETGAAGGRHPVWWAVFGLQRGQKHVIMTKASKKKTEHASYARSGLPQGPL